MLTVTVIAPICANDADDVDNVDDSMMMVMLMDKSAGLPACLIGRCCSCFCSWFVLVSVLGLYLFLCSLAGFCFV